MRIPLSLYLFTKALVQSAYEYKNRKEFATHKHHLAGLTMFTWQQHESRNDFQPLEHITLLVNHMKIMREDTNNQLSRLQPRPRTSWTGPQHKMSLRRQYVYNWTHEGTSFHLLWMSGSCLEAQIHRCGCTQKLSCESKSTYTQHEPSSACTADRPWTNSCYQGSFHTRHFRNKESCLLWGESMHGCRNGAQRLVLHFTPSYFEDFLETVFCFECCSSEGRRMYLASWPQQREHTTVDHKGIRFLMQKHHFCK